MEFSWERWAWEPRSLMAGVVWVEEASLGQELVLEGGLLFAEKVAWEGQAFLDQELLLPMVAVLEGELALVEGASWEQELPLEAEPVLGVVVV